VAYRLMTLYFCR